MFRSLSSLEARVVLALQWDDRRWTDRSEIVRILGNQASADRVIRSLRKKRWIERIVRGRYLLIPADRGLEGVPEGNVLLVGSQIVDPYYFGYATAAAHYSFTTQSRHTVWIASTKPVRPKRIRGSTFRFVRLSKKRFFGYAPTRVFESEVSMSDLEKTVIDCVDKPQYAGGIGEVTRTIVVASRRILWDAFADYALRMDSVALIQRLGYLAERAGVKIPPTVREKLRSAIKLNSRSYLGSTLRWGKSGTYDGAWQVVVNVPDREILSEL